MASYAIPVLGHYAMLACFLTTNMGICTWSYTEQQLSCQSGVAWSWHPLGIVRSERMVCGLLPDSVLTILNTVTLIIYQAVVVNADSMLTILITVTLMLY